MWADTGYNGTPLARYAQAAAAITVEVVARTSPHSFQVLRRRWVIERTFGWLMRYRRLARDYERTTANAEAMIYWATVIIMTRRLARYENDQPPIERWGGERPRPNEQAALSTGSKPAVAITMGRATKQGLVVEEPDPAGSRWKITRLTSSGERAQRAYYGLTGAIEGGWRSRFGAARVAALRDALEPLATGDPPPLFGGLTPYEDGWRAQVRAPAVLPHYPMVLHRGGYPDGA
jgi:hypothetical protein